jgi:hypothetical protein
MLGRALRPASTIPILRRRVRIAHCLFSPLHYFLVGRGILLGMGMILPSEWPFPNALRVTPLFESTSEPVIAANALPVNPVSTINETNAAVIAFVMTRSFLLKIAELFCLSVGSR